ncbi:MAG: HAS-barrel domain-containing protein [Cyanobacteria bacterium P01_H01_bin.121]
MRLPLPQFAGRQRSPRHIAEVIETATTEFLAQCLEPEDLRFPVMPAFGSWVKAADEETGAWVYGIVYHATTSPIDSVHRARALGLSLETLRDEQPQIFAMLKTEFQAAIVGFETASTNGSAANPGKIYQYLPPRPPQVHQAVYECTATEVLHFTEELEFMRTLLQLNSTPVDSLIAATLRETYRLRKADRPWLVHASRMLSTYLKEAYDRLRQILSQVQLV